MDRHNGAAPDSESSLSSPSPSSLTRFDPPHGPGRLANPKAFDIALKPIEPELGSPGIHSAAPHPFWNHRCARWLIVVGTLVNLTFAAWPVVNHIRARVNEAHGRTVPVAWGFPKPAINLIGHFNKDYDLWRVVGVKTLRGESVYPEPSTDAIFPFMYPPSAAVLLALSATLGEPFQVVLLDAINMLSWVAVVIGSVLLATGRAWGRHPVLYVLPSLAVLILIQNIFMIGQPNLGLLALMVGAFLALRAKREGLAGALVALAAGIKAFPLLAIVYFLWRRHDRATVSTIVTLAALLLVAPLPFRGAQGAWEDLSRWTRGMLFKYDETSISQRPYRSFSYKNQSIMGLAHRLFRDVPADGEKLADAQLRGTDPRLIGPVWKVTVVDLGFRGVSGLILASAALAGLVFVAVMPSRNARTERSDTLEWAMLTLLIVIFSPLSFNYAYVWMIFPLTVAWTLALESPKGSARRRGLLVWAGVASLLPATAALEPRVAQAYGNLFWPSVVLLVGLGWELRRLGRQASTHSAQAGFPAPSTLTHRTARSASQPLSAS